MPSKKVLHELREAVATFLSAYARRGKASDPVVGVESQGIPGCFREALPDVISTMDSPATHDEVALADSVREGFFLPDQPRAYMVDIVRAFRPLKGARVYVEVGSRDKGNIAWLSHILADDALIVDVDLAHIKAAEDKLRAYIKDTQSYWKIEGDSVAARTIAEVRQALGWQQADAIFLNSSHMYNHFLKEVDLYLPLLRSGGLLLFHDLLWEGNEYGKGKAQAAIAIDRFIPVYAVITDLPVHRFIPRETKQDEWGGVGVIIK